MSNQTSSLTFECPGCHNVIEADVSASLQSEFQCPYCGQAVRPPSPKSSAYKITVLTAVVLCVGAVGAGIAIALKYAARPSTQQITEPPVWSVSTNQFTISALSLQKEGSLRYAVGTASNELSQQRFGVKIQLELLDTNEWRVGIASDYRSIVHSNEVWRFRALVTTPGAVSASLLLIREEQ